MTPLQHIVQLAKGGNQGAVASLRALAKGGDKEASAFLTAMGMSDENGSTGEEPEGAINKSYDPEALKKSLGDLLTEVEPGLSESGAEPQSTPDPAPASNPAPASDPIKKGSAPIKNDDDEGADDNLEFEFEFDEDDEDPVAKSLAATNDRLDRLALATVGTGRGMLNIEEGLRKGLETLGSDVAELKQMFGSLLKGLKRPTQPVGVVQPGQKPADKPIGGLQKGTQDPNILRKSLQDRIDSTEPGSPDWNAAMAALNDLTVGNTNTARALLQGS